MTLDEAIFTALSANAGVTAIAGDRSYPVQAPQSAALPFVVWQRIATVPINSHDGPAGLDQTTMQFACFAATFTAAHDLRNAVRAAIEDVTLGNSARGVVTSIRDTVENEPVPPVFRSDVDIDFIAAP